MSPTHKCVQFTEKNIALHFQAFVINLITRAPRQFLEIESMNIFPEILRGNKIGTVCGKCK